ncbi:MAG: DUF6430 domain-containing protein [Euryarchaeota archaeon]|nr:DUF6430 domain-containing protein [Euryarchaeota archaeon]
MFVEDAKDMIKNIRDIVTAPVVNIMLLCGFSSVILSFCRVNNVEGFSFTSGPIWILFIIGCLLLLGSPIMFIFTREDRKITRRIKIEDGLSLPFGRVSVSLKLGKIQEVSGSSESTTVILPANTTFIDDCITDKNSALGAFFLERYPDKISDIATVIEEQLKRSGYKKSENGTYLPGTTIIMPSPYNTPSKILITASTVRREITGIKAEPSTICECIRQVFMLTADKKISKLRMPILGSGHGGLDINDALLFLILAIKHYSKQYHHVKSVDIIVTEIDAPNLKDINRLQYLTRLEVKKK